MRNAFGNYSLPLIIMFSVAKVQTFFHSHNVIDIFFASGANSPFASYTKFRFAVFTGSIYAVVHISISSTNFHNLHAILSPTSNRSRATRMP